MKITSIVTATALTAAMGLGTMLPAKADGAASTRNILLGAAAVVAGVAIESNAASKNHRANSVQGYLPDGATVYQDGHVVEPNGQSYYPGNNGQQVACNGQNCYYSGNNGNYNNGNNGGYYGNNGYNNGNVGYSNDRRNGNWQRDRR